MKELDIIYQQPFAIDNSYGSTLLQSQLLSSNDEYLPRMNTLSVCLVHNRAFYSVRSFLLSTTHGIVR